MLLIILPLLLTQTYTLTGLQASNFCHCDLTLAFCDYDCCCDTDCSTVPFP